MIRSTPPQLLTALVALVACAACGKQTDPIHPSYDPCAPGDTCGLMTACERAELTTAAGAAAWFCTHNACVTDLDCPGFSARCVPIVGDGGARPSQCLRGCLGDDDCRVGTTCHGVLLAGQPVGVCAVGAGYRACRASADCAPFADECDLTDAGASPFDASATMGRCRLDLSVRP